MKCPHCNADLIHGGDHDGEDEDDYLIVSNYSCPECQTYVLVYFPKDYRPEMGN